MGENDIMAAKRSRFLQVYPKPGYRRCGCGPSDVEEQWRGEAGRERGKEGASSSLNMALLNLRDRPFIPFTAASCLRVFRGMGWGHRVTQEADRT